MSDIVIGIDIGGTNTYLGLIDKKGKCLEQGHLETHRYQDADKYFQALFSELDRLVGNNSEINLKGVGIGAPNGNYYKSTIEHAPNLNWGGVTRMGDIFEEKYSLPVCVTNDANSAAIGEMYFGKAVGMKDFLSITIGTGLGSGIVIDGKLVYGYSGFAGELGHMNAIMDGRPCSCGKKGCLEAYVSARGIVQTAIELLEEEEGQKSFLSRYSENLITPKAVYDAAKTGDPLALKTFDYTGKILGSKLADAVAFTSPEAIFLYGGIVNSGKFILEPTRKYFDEYLMKIFNGTCKIELSGLNVNQGAILGAGALIWDKIL